MRRRTLLPAALLALVPLSAIDLPGFSSSAAASSASQPAPAPPVVPVTPLPSAPPVTPQPQPVPAAPVVPPAPVVPGAPVVPPAPRPAAAAPRPRPPAEPRPPAPSRLEMVERVLDSSRWGWREAGVTIRLAHHPEQCCHWGVYDFRDRTLWIGPGAFRTEARLRYVVLHELAHAWQWISEERLAVTEADMARWGKGGLIAAAEAQADCIAEIWGAPDGYYWQCPAPAVDLTARRLAGDWS